MRNRILGYILLLLLPFTGLQAQSESVESLRSKAGVVGQALPDTRVVTSTDPDAATVGYGWRRLPNYYAMRDCLNAPYMN